jgi:hypothetical protein
MDFNAYVVEKLAETRLADLRAARARAALAESARVEPHGVGPAVGSALIRLGRWLAQGEAVAAPNGGVRAGR